MDEVTSGTLEADIAQEAGGKGRKHQPYLYEVRLITCVWDSLWVCARSLQRPRHAPNLKGLAQSTDPPKDRRRPEARLGVELK